MLARLLGLGGTQDYSDEVYFSRDIHNNVLQQWMLIVKNRKFELTRMPDGSYVVDCDYDRNWTLERERTKPQNRSRGGWGNGYDSWIVVRIGWSRLSGKDVDYCFADARAYYPPRLSWTQCQDFLRRFGDGFIGRHDYHYQFFFDSTAIERQSVPQLPPPPAAVVQESQARARQREQQRVHNINMVNRLNAMQGGMMISQQQTAAQNAQIQQNQYNYGV